MKTALYIIAAIVLLSACGQNPKQAQPVRIYPFYPYLGQDSVNIEKKSDSSLYAYYILYNLTTNDTSFIKKSVLPVLDSIQQQHTGVSEFRITFYKKGEHFDTSYHETRNDPLFNYDNNLLAIFNLLAGGSRHGYWEFYKNGELMGSNDVKIEDIPEKNSTMQQK